MEYLPPQIISNHCNFPLKYLRLWLCWGGRVSDLEFDRLGAGVGWFFSLMNGPSEGCQRVCSEICSCYRLCGCWRHILRICGKFRVCWSVVLFCDVLLLGLRCGWCQMGGYYSIISNWWIKISAIFWWIFRIFRGISELLLIHDFFAKRFKISMEAWSAVTGHDCT